MIIYTKFSGYQAGRRLYLGGGGGGGGGGDGGDATGDATGEGGLGGSPAAAPDGSGGYADPQSGAYIPASTVPNTGGSYALGPYTSQNLSSINTDIYRPSYDNYAPGLSNAISNYGQNMQSPFGQFVSPFSQQSQGIAGLYNYPEYEDYGISGLTR